MAVQALMKRGKRHISKYLKDECSKQNREKHIQELLDFLLDPEKTLDDFERIDWCRWLIAGGMTFDEFSKEVRKYDNAVACGLVWTANFVAYRCRTCGISPCMSLCADCFHAADHTGHDFNMFRSQAGGACDCGDVSVMKAEGFCPRHGPDEAKQFCSPPPSLLAMAEVMMPRLIFRLIQHERECCRPDMLETFKLNMKDSDIYLTFLHSLSDMGAAMRRVMTNAITSNEVYAAVSKGIPVSRTRQLSDGAAEAPSSTFYEQIKFNYLAALDSLQCPEIPQAFKDIPGLAVPLKHQTLLEELIFWTVKYEFPQKQVTLLLSLLPDPQYKEAFTRAFVQHYSRISIALVNSADRQTISNRVVHVSIQLLSPEDLAVTMVTEYKLLYVMLSSLSHMFSDIVMLSEMNDMVHNYHMVVDCCKEALKEHCYWPIVSDLINILSHKPIAFRFMSDQRLLDFWFELVSHFQGMNLNHRELSNHIEYEPDTYYAAFSAELEICSSPMWLLLVHCVDESTRCYTKSVIDTVTSRLQQWFDAINIKPMSKPSPLQVSFHLPLHRYLSVFVAQAVRSQGLQLSDVLPSHELLQMLMIHPLQLQVVFSEIFCGMWVRNGLQIKGQALTYVQCHFCNSMVDADLYLLQICATRLDPDYFVKTVLERYHVMEMLTFAPAEKRKRGYLEPENAMQMLEGAVTLIATLLSIRTNLGMSDEDLARREMLTLLCMNDRTHSQLTELMPEKCGLTGQTKDFEPILKQVADYKAPNFEAGGMQQGMYMPKETMWECEFDPLYVLLRAMHRKDFQQAMDRFSTHVRQKGLFSGSGMPWPPFRVPPAPPDAYSGLMRLLHCRTMHGQLFTLLYKSLNEPQTSEAVLYTTVYLLELAVTMASPKQPRECPIPSEPRDQHFSEWFPTDDIFCNLRHVIHSMSVMISEPVRTEVAPTRMSTSSSSSDGMDALMDEPDVDMYQLAPSIVQGGPALLTAMISPNMANLSGGTMATLNTNHPGALVLAPSQNEADVADIVQTVLEQAVPLPALPPATMATSTTVAHVTRRSQGVSAVLDRRMVKQSIAVEESMLSLLLKLHAKLSGKPNSFVPKSVRKQTTDENSRIGDGPFFIGKLLDRLSDANPQCAQIISDTYHSSLPKANEGKKEMGKEERRRRAQEKQRKVMAQMASNQKKFMENFMAEMGETAEDDLSEEDMSSESPQQVLQTYDCVICNQTTPSTDDKPIGLVTLVQPTSVLGHRRAVMDPLVLPLSDQQAWHPATCSSEMDCRLKLLLRNFQGDSGLLSVNIGWKGGVHAQTCGHYVHLDCHASYMKSLSIQQLQVSSGEYWCPLCRQLANTTLPISPDEPAALHRPVSADDPGIVHAIAELLVTRPITQGSLTRAMGKVMENLSECTYAKYRQVSRSPSPENIQVFVASIARVNLELEWLQYHSACSSASPSAGATAAASSSNRRACMVPLLRVLGMHIKLLATHQFCNLWSHITGIPLLTDSSDKLQPYLEYTPILLKDPCAVLLQILLNLPHTLHKGEFECIVRALFNVVYIQAIAVMTCKFSEEERDAWQHKTREESMTSMESLLGRVVKLLRNSALYNEGSPVDPHIPAICGSVWSPQSVEVNLQASCLPYLRIAALLQYHLYRQPLPQVQELDESVEYFTLCQYLGLIDCSQPAAECTVSSAALHWYSAEPPLLLQAWCTQLAQFANKQAYTARTLLQFTTKWYGPHLITLPKQYESIFQFYRQKMCKTCNSVPRDPALCLMCGALLCFKDTCCRQQLALECVQHSIDCGGGTGIILVVNSSVTVVIRGQRACLWGSVYLDEHGEEDRDLKRGKPLYLSMERYRLLQHQWVTHSFIHSCRRWIFHQDRL